MKVKPATQYALLGALASGPKHGYEILSYLNSDLGSTWYISPSQLYTLLKKLEREGYLKSNVKEQPTRPSKRIFSLTASGRKQFMNWVTSPTKHIRDLRIEFLARLFFIHKLDLKGGNKLIDAQAQVLREARRKIRTEITMAKAPYQELVFHFKLSTVEAWLDWLLKHAKTFIK